MNCFANRIVAAKGERDVANAAGGQCVGQFVAYELAGPDEIHRIIVVFFDASADRENIRIENDIFGWKVRLFHQQLVGTRTDRGFAFRRVGLTLFVEGHHHHSSAITSA